MSSFEESWLFVDVTSSKSRLSDLSWERSTGEYVTGEASHGSVRPLSSTSTMDNVSSLGRGAGDGG